MDTDLEFTLSDSAMMTFEMAFFPPPEILDTLYSHFSPSNYPAAMFTSPGISSPPL